jgi:hypothetical protein
MKTCEIPKEKSVAAFRNYDFENNYVPEKFQGEVGYQRFAKGYFIPIARREMRKLAKNIGAELASFSNNTFEFSCMFKKDDRFIYVRIEDVRWNDWYGRVLYRTADNANDCKGGSNNWCSYDQLEESVKSLFDVMARRG